MSLINDALKKAQKALPSNPTSAVKPLQPVVASPSKPRWLLPSMVIVMAIIVVAVAVGFFGWAGTHQRPETVNVHESHDSLPLPPPAIVIRPPPIAVEARPVMPLTTNRVPATKALVSPALPITLPTNNLPSIPKLQGIFYSSTNPAAILEGKTVYAGDQIRQYRIKIITKDRVTLVGPDKKEIQLNMEN